MGRRLLLDLVMLVLLLTVFARPLTGSAVHEAAGIVLMALSAAHSLLNRYWYLSMFRGRYDLLRSLATCVNLALVVAVLTTLITAVPISRYVFAYLAIDNDMWVAQLHITAATWLFVLASVHLGFHWETMKRGLLFPVDGAVTTGGRIGRWGLLILACCLGARASLNRNIGSKLIM
ncbi:MAG TPA: DUF4405 domain-containing protein, partial [Candidatus Ozemobacteraceae bacterium]|nr:DUF4405 domain-containing protein [Candidatus Ozemobacteraceae bacterium]